MSRRRGCRCSTVRGKAMDGRRAVAGMLPSGGCGRRRPLLAPAILLGVLAACSNQHTVVCGNLSRQGGVDLLVQQGLVPHQRGLLTVTVCIRASCTSMPSDPAAQYIFVPDSAVSGTTPLPVSVKLAAADGRTFFSGATSTRPRQTHLGNGPCSVPLTELRVTASTQGTLVER